jgi:hypothetical protein
MKLSEVHDPETFMYIKALHKVSSRFKVGDYVKLYEWEYDDDDNMVWSPVTKTVAAFRSRIDHNKNVHADIAPIYKIIRSDCGYIEAEAVNPAPEDDHVSSFFHDDVREVTGYHLRGLIEDYYCNIDDDETDAETAVDAIVDKFIKLDEDYTDSIIFESLYKPYENSQDYKELIKKVHDAQELERKELLRLRALKGHATRRRKKEMAAKEQTKAQSAVVLSDLLKALITAKTKPKKVSKKRGTKKVVKAPKRKTRAKVR